MRKRKMLRKMICIALTAVMVMQYIPFQSFASDSEKISTETSDGINFNKNTLIRTRLAYSKSIATFEATIEFAKNTTGKGGVILGNYKKDGEKCYSLEINESGAPRLYLIGNSVFEYCFDEINVYTGEKMHLAVVRDLAKAEMRCYVDGTLKQTVPADANDTEEIKPTNGACIGSDFRATNENYCRGKILNVKVYSDVRSGSEIANDVTTLSKDDIIAYYDFANATSNDTVITDGSGKGMDLYPLVWLDERPNIDAYDFSMVAIGDTQIVTQEYGKNLKDIYDYVLNNAEEHNTQFVFGLGDIINRNTDEQWNTAKEQITRMDGVLRYSLLRGNHDSQGRINENFPYSAFKTLMQTNYPGVGFGAYNEQEMYNTWQELTVDSLKYLIFTLDSGASDEVLAWASDIIEAHPEHRVIVTTHAYLNIDGSTLDAQESSAPTNWTDHNKVEGIVNNNGDQMWDEFVKQHENIQMVLCGHMDVDDVVVTQSEGVHGNIVTSMLINPQGMDAEIEGGTGMVATLYFSQGGNKVQVEYYSPIRNQWLVSMHQDSLDLNSEADVYVDEADIADYTTVTGSKIIRTAPRLSKAGYEDYIFAGWYRDFACTTPVGNTITAGQFFAKYLPSDTFTVKCQVAGDFSRNDTTAKLRIVSSVDNLKYSAVGFDIVYRAGETNEVEIPHNTNTVYSRIHASEDGVKYEYSPNVFDLNSKYFVTATLVGIAQVDYDKLIKITPYIITEDGTKSTGETRYVRMSDVYEGRINVPVTINNNAEMQSGTVKLSYDNTLFTYAGLFDQGDFGTTTVTDNQNGTISITSENIEGSGVIANLRFHKKSSAIIPKKTTFDVIEENFGGTIPSPKHLEYSSDYQGVADTSWYNDSDRAFVITSPAELYGVAELSNTTTDFSNQKIYLGADIVVNKGTVEEWLAEGFDKNKLYKWEQSIGINAWERRFDGIFDGQGHTVRGVYGVHAEACYGFFGAIASNAVIRNLSLENSYLSNTAHTTGGVVGLANGGDIINVYSKVQLQVAEHAGGILGRTNTINKVNVLGCWYDGTMTASGQNAGGIVGNAYGRGDATEATLPQPVVISDCLYTGTIASSHGEPCIAGVLARIDHKYRANVTIDNCLSDGTLSMTVDAAKNTYVGSLLGCMYNSNTIKVSSSFASSESYVKAVGAGTVQGSVPRLARKFLTGYLGYTLISNPGNAELWIARDGKTPAMAMFADGLDMKDAIVSDTSWYDGKNNTIMDAGDLYGFAKLSLTNSFAGETITLGANIQINDTADYDSWASTAPKYQWLPIGINTYFAGTFGGANRNSVHTIRGIYMKNDHIKSGLIAKTTATATVQNLRLEDSYFENTSTVESWMGSIVGDAAGTFQTLYSNADVVLNASNKNPYTGGMFGIIYKNGLVARECWFDGTVTSNNQFVGGFTGAIGTGTEINFTDCLMTGTVTSITSTDTVPAYAAGFIGYALSAESIKLTDCLNTGTVRVSQYSDWTERRGTSSVIGCVWAEDVVCTDVYTIEQVKFIDGTSVKANLWRPGIGWHGSSLDVKGETSEITSIDSVKAAGGYTLTGLDFSKSGSWTARQNDVPALKIFVPTQDVYTE